MSRKNITSCTSSTCLHTPYHHLPLLRRRLRLWLQRRSAERNSVTQLANQSWSVIDRSACYHEITIPKKPTVSVGRVATVSRPVAAQRSGLSSFGGETNDWSVVFVAWSCGVRSWSWCTPPNLGCKEIDCPSTYHFQSTSTCPFLYESQHLGCSGRFPTVPHGGCWVRSVATRPDSIHRRRRRPPSNEAEQAR